ncbi:hypothetical protein CHS0354_004906 [Potamilus streckersoni]|uniref:Cadherin domain-containing protein n=1 Tax=Potamilus streckersoni TaxID=2493646 RepID=A0AAE0TJ20_9BIVA|nr:hypothetical protein CHS0354_004906 [Potamilus streckersoni]
MIIYLIIFSILPSPSLQGYGYIMEEAHYMISTSSCTCGTVKNWEIYPKVTGYIQFQVWRRQNPSSYLLVGENTFKVTGSMVNKKVVFTVPPNERITVRSGDYLGWYCPAANVVGYVNGTTAYPDDLRKVSMSDYSAGATYNWGSGSVTIMTDTAYAIRAYLESNLSPYFTNLPRSVSITNAWVVNSQLYTVTVDDVEDNDVSSITLSVATSATYMTFDTSTYKVKLSTTPSPTASDTIVLKATDQCGNTGTATFTLVIVNEAPTITTLPSVAEIYEYVTTETLLHTLNATEKVGSYSCSLTSTSPISTNFVVKLLSSSSTVYGVYSVQGASYSYDTTKYYSLTIQCNDANSGTGTGVLHVEIRKNNPPVFTNINNAQKVVASYLTTISGDTLFTVSVTDAENDALTFSMTSNPSPAPFEITGGGNIKATSDFIRLYQTGYDLQISVSDGRTTVGPKTVTIIVTDIDDVPRLGNLPLAYAITVYEDTAVGTTLHSVGYYDLDTSDSHIYSVEFSPGSGINYFTLNSATGVLKTLAAIDYETIESLNYTLTITLSDTKDSSSATVTINIGNVNEAPKFHQTEYRLNPSEGGLSNTVLGDPGFVIDDVDKIRGSDQAYFSYDCANATQYFIMDRTSGIVYYAADFDFDTAGISSNVTCLVTVKDNGGLTSTATLQIQFTDVNDNSPVFSQTFDYQFFAGPYYSVGQVIGQTYASDADATSQYNTVYYSINMSAYADEYIAINTNGTLYVKMEWDESVFNYGSIHVLTVTARDVGNNAATATVTLVVPQTTTTTTTTTERPIKYEDDPRNVALIVLLAVAVLAILVLITCLFFRYVEGMSELEWYRCCRCSKKGRWIGFKGCCRRGCRLWAKTKEERKREKDQKIRKIKEKQRREDEIRQEEMQREMEEKRKQEEEKRIWRIETERLLMEENERKERQREEVDDVEDGRELMSLRESDNEISVITNPMAKFIG